MSHWPAGWAAAYRLVAKGKQRCFPNGSKTVSQTQARLAQAWLLGLSRVCRTSCFAVWTTDTAAMGRLSRGASRRVVTWRV